MKKELKIEITKNTNACFAYTDRNQSYLQIHCKKDKLTEGLWIKNRQLLKNIFFYDCDSKKNIFPSSFSKIEYKPHEVVLYYKSAKLTLSLLIQDAFEKKLDLPVLKYDFCDLSNKFVFGIILPSKEKVFFYDDKGKLSSDNLFTEIERKTKKMILVKYQSESKFQNTGFFTFDKFDFQKEFSIDLVQVHKNHLLKIEDFFNNFKIDNCNEFDNSVYWALFSGWLLVTGLEHRGIWAGLPWFRDNWGRDTFIALPGILLVSGQFQEAKSVISSFAQFQDKNPESKTYGRIPNRYIDEKNVIYNTADGTLWFIREVWEYLQYTNDLEFLSKIWSVIKLALEIDIKNRTDKYGFLIHGDADTWMDARIQGKNPLSPRGSRANDIQILWYTSLKIAEKMAILVNDKDSEILFKTKAENVKSCFKKFFYKKNQNLIGDFLGKEDVLDYSLRSNVFFVFSIFNHLGLEEQIFTESEKYAIIKNAFEELAFNYGILSLSQNHQNFHPFHDKSKRYHKDAAYHNGTIWLWNSGAAIDCLCDLHQQNAVYKLSKFHEKQMIDFNDSKTFASRCLGSLSENINAYKVKKQIVPSGTWSQAWSVSEFSRTFFQSYVGIVPKLLDSKIDFKPCFPSKWKEGSVGFAFGNNFATVNWKLNNKKQENSNEIYFDEELNKHYKINLYDFEISLEKVENLELCVTAHFENQFEKRSFTFNENGKINFSAGILFDIDDFSFSRQKDLFLNKPNSLKSKNYLTKKILSQKSQGFFTPVK